MSETGRSEAAEIAKFADLVGQLNRAIDARVEAAISLADFERKLVESTASVHAARARDQVAEGDLDQVRMKISSCIRASTTGRGEHGNQG